MTRRAAERPHDAARRAAERPRDAARRALASVLPPARVGGASAGALSHREPSRGSEAIRPELDPPGTTLGQPARIDRLAMLVRDALVAVGPQLGRRVARARAGASAGGLSLVRQSGGDRLRRALLAVAGRPRRRSAVAP